MLVNDSDVCQVLTMEGKEQICSLSTYIGTILYHRKHLCSFSFKIQKYLRIRESRELAKFNKYIEVSNVYLAGM